MATAFKDVGCDSLAVEQIQHAPTVTFAQFSGE
jgi:hypothetical protein